MNTTERHGGVTSVCCVNAAAGDISGLTQTIELNQDKPAPIVASGWSKAQNVSGQADGNYSLYLDIQYPDETHLYGQTAPFACGTHDWQFASVTIKPTKPIKSVTYHALFRGKSGKVWFDDLSLKPADRPQASLELLRNGSLEEPGNRGRLIDVAKTRQLTVPANSGRVFLYAPPSTHDLAATGQTLTIATQPALGEVRVRVDGFDYWTHSGYWGTSYKITPNFGAFSIRFDKPGKHVIELIDVVPADMKTPSGYSSPTLLGDAMDPSNPTKPSNGRKFHFQGWTGLKTSGDPRIEIEVSGDARLSATFEMR